MTLSSILLTFTISGIGLTLKKLRDQAHDVFLKNWNLGLTAFGGPPVHFQIVCELILMHHTRVRNGNQTDERKVPKKIR